MTNSHKVGSAIKRETEWLTSRLVADPSASGLTALFDELIAHGVNLTSLRDGIDPDAAAGKLMREGIETANLVKRFSVE